MSQSRWVNALEACEHLNVNETTLRRWQELGYLKPGTHWRRQFADRPEPVEYNLSWCKEEMDYWRGHDAPIMDVAA